MPDFTDQSLTPRARDLALWLCDLTHASLDPRSVGASIDMLLRELPDFWTAEEVVRFSAEVRQQVGAKASRMAWLSAAGWLVGEREQLPDKAPRVPRQELQRRIGDGVRGLLAQWGA